MQNKVAVPHDALVPTATRYSMYFLCNPHKHQSPICGN